MNKIILFSFLINLFKKNYSSTHLVEFEAKVGMVGTLQQLALKCWEEAKELLLEAKGKSMQNGVRKLLIFFLEFLVAILKKLKFWVKFKKGGGN